MPKNITTLRVTPGQTVYCFDKTGKQIMEPVCMLELFAGHVEKLGHDPEGALCEIAPGDNWRITKQNGKWGIERT